MEIIQIRLKKMAVFCYLIGDESSKTCALIDPAFNTKKILKIAQENGYQITHLINTHCHSDHSAGNASIIAATGAKLYIHHIDANRLGKILNRIFSLALGGKGSPAPDVLLHHGNKIRIGETTLDVIHTPGHSPGSICLYADNNIFTGDTLFVGATGRTDLLGGSHEQLLKSVHKNIYSLPGKTKIWPGHDYGPTSYSTVNNEKNTNPYTSMSDSHQEF